MDPLAKLQRLAKRWGGDVKCLSQEQWDALKKKMGATDLDLYRARHSPHSSRTSVEASAARTCDFYESPFSSLDLAVRWKKKQVVFRGEAKWYEVIHEMGHVFACPIAPPHSDEYDFLGWEMAMVHHIGAPMKEWREGNEDYGLGEIDMGTREKPSLLNASLGDLDDKQFRWLQRDRLAAAHKLGLLRKTVFHHHTPVAIR